MEGMKILHLTLFRKWFDEIASGAKTREFRRKTDFWRRRLVGREYDVVHFRNGYRRGAPFMRVEFLGLEDGVWEGEGVFAIRLGRVLEVRAGGD